MYVYLIIFISLLAYDYIIELFYNIVFFYNLYKIYGLYLNNNINATDIKNLMKSIDNVGFFSIKLIQWGLTRLKLYNLENIDRSILDPLDRYYEDCNFHDDSYTYYILNKNYDYNFKKNCELIKIASGSIAQVYKLRFTKSKKTVALKIIHPNLEKKLLVSKFLSKIIYNIYKIVTKKYVNLNFDVFFDGLYKQLDLRNEYNNQSFFYKNYKNKYILVPKPYLTTKDTLFMEYIEGTQFKNLSCSLYKKTKIIIDLKMFVYNTWFKKKLIHADLHNGNWKLKYCDKIKKYKLIVYDYGLCLDIKNIDIFLLREHLSQNKLDDVVDCILKLIINNKDIVQKYKNCVKQLIEKSDCVKQLNTTKILSIIYTFCLDNNIKINNELLSIFIILLVNDNNIGQFKDRLSEKNNSIENYDYPKMLSYCKLNNLYQDFRNHIRLYINKHKTKECLFDYIDKKYQ